MRALCKALGQDWDTVYVGLSVYGSSRVQAPAHGIGALFRQRRSLRFSPGSLPRALCGIAQEVEQRPYKPCVMGSIPLPTTTPPVVYRA